MSFGVPSSETQHVWPHAANDDAILVVVRQAAERLAADLHRAQQQTRDWADEELSAALVDVALAACLHRLAATGRWGESNRLPSSELWRIAGHWLEPGALQHRARFKPLGYAGDYLMLHWIDTGHRTGHPLGRVFDRYFLAQAAPQAVRSRIEQVAAAIVAHRLEHSGEAFQVVSVGSGPGADLARAAAILPEDSRQDMQAVLFDMDPEALQFAHRAIEPHLLAGAVTCHRENLFRLAQRHFVERFPEADVLVCSGLFDYLEDEPATKMLSLFWQRLRPDGLLLLGNFAPHNPTRAYMEWIGNWYLLYRTAAAMHRLAAAAGIPPDHYTLGSERLGVDWFLVARKGPAF